MSRLIDADALLKSRKESESEILSAEYLEFEKLVNSQPTAYDKGRIEAQIMSKLFESETLHFESLGKKNVSAISYYGGMVDAFNIAIQIIKNGGMEE